jgi:quercetin dioxygenase-like cupin family protein
MTALASVEPIAHPIEPRSVEVLDVMGATIQLLTGPADDDSSPCVMRGTIPPGVFVPLHSHRDPETFVMVAGEVEGIAKSDGEVRWVRIVPGDIFHVPGGAKHAFWNRSHEPAVSIVMSTSRLGRFFQEAGTPMPPGASPPEQPSGEKIQHFLRVAERYRHWIADAEENAQLQMSLLPVS